MEKFQNKVEVAEEIGCGNELKSRQDIGIKNGLSFDKNKNNFVGISPTKNGFLKFMK